MHTARARDGGRMQNGGVKGVLTAEDRGEWKGYHELCAAWKPDEVWEKLRERHYILVFSRISCHGYINLIRLSGHDTLRYMQCGPTFFSRDIRHKILILEAFRGFILRRLRDHPFILGNCKFKYV
jgi:hypothetical protein